MKKKSHKSRPLVYISFASITTSSQNKLEEIHYPITIENDKNRAETISENREKVFFNPQIIRKGDLVIGRESL